METSRMMDKISREFTVKRGETNVVYRFTTYPFIFTAKPKAEEAIIILEYLRKIFTEGVPDLSGCMSVTECPTLIIPVIEVKNDYVEHAKKADYQGCGRGQHHRVQHQLLKYHPKTIAIEVPVFNKEWSGHIDVLGLSEGFIDVGDFKPKAHKERKAASQVWRYIQLLAAATGLPTSRFRGFYFDDKRCFQLAI